MSNIWLINHFAVSPDLPGGTRHFDFAKELVGRGHQVAIFASDFSYQQRKYYKLRKRQMSLIEDIEGVKFVWVRATSYSKNNWQRIFNMVSFAFYLLLVGFKQPKPDVIVGSSPHLFAAFSAYILSRLKRAKFILEIRDLWPQVLIDMGRAKENSLVIQILRKLERFLYKRADKIMVLASGSAKYLQQYGVLEEKIVFVPNGVHLKHLKSTLPRVAARARYGFTKFTLVYAGAHGPANALHTILKAAQVLKNNKDIEFVLVGDGTEKKNLKQYASDQGIENVKFLDPIPKDEMPNFFLAADVGVITLGDIELFRYGVSPNKLFDYMGSSLPVICSVGGDMGKMVEEANAGISVSAEDWEKLAESALRLNRLSDFERIKLGENGAKYVCDRYSRERQVDRLEELFKEMSRG